MKRLLPLLLIAVLVVPVSALQSDVVGIYWNGWDSSPTLTRIDWNNNTIAASDFNHTFPWREMVRDNSSESWFQNQMLVKIPAFYYYVDRPAENVTKWYIYANTTANLTGMPSGFSLHPAFYVNQSPVKAFYMSAFEGSVQHANGTYNRGDFSGVNAQPGFDKLSSVAGSKPTSGANNSLTMTSFRNLSQSRGMNWEIQSFNHVSAVQLLYLVEYSSFYSQNVLSAGVTQITDDSTTNMAIPTGCTAGVGVAGCMNIGNASGEVNISHYQTGQYTYPMSYRGIENPYGNIWKWVAGINIKADRNPWIANYGFAADTFSGSYQDTGLTLPSSNGYQSAIANSLVLSSVFLPSSVSGSSSTYLTDYYFQGTGNRAVAIGAPWNLVGNSGFFTILANSASTTSARTIGARLDLTKPTYANFSYTQVGNKVYFSDLSYNVSTRTGLQKNVTSWNWSFGDGNVSTLQNPSNVYPVSGGTYTVNLTVSDGTYSDTYLSTVTYLEVPEANFTATPTSGSRPLTVTFSDASSGSPTSWYWDFGDGNTSVLQNPTHIYDIIGNYSVNFSATNSAGTSWFNRSDYIWVTNATGFNQQDVSLTPSFTVTMHITDSTNGAPIPVVLVQDSNLQEYTATNGTAYFTEAYGTVVFYLSATGYTSKAVSYIIDEDRTVTVQMVPAEETTISNWYTPKQVAITISRYPNAVRVPGANISLQAIGTSLQDDEQLQTMYGINPTAANQMLNGTLLMNGTAGSDGTVVFTVLSSIQYSATIIDPSDSQIYTATLYPGEDPYTIWIGASPLDVNDTVQQSLNGTKLWVSQPNSSFVTLNLRYQDTSGYTSDVRFIVKAANNMTTIYEVDLGNPGTGVVLANHTHKNVRGQGFYYYYNASRVIP